MVSVRFSARQRRERRGRARAITASVTLRISSSASSRSLMSSCGVEGGRAGSWRAGREVGADRAAAETQALGRAKRSCADGGEQGSGPCSVQALSRLQAAVHTNGTHPDVNHPAPSCCSIYVMQLTIVSRADQPPILPELATSAQKSAGRGRVGHGGRGL